MSSRPQMTSFPVISNGDMSDDIISQVTVIQKLSMLSYDISWDGTAPDGEITVEVSNTYSQNGDGTVRNPGIWHTLPITTMAVDGDTGTGAVDIYATGFSAVRLVYTSNSGVGSLQAVISAKVS